MKATLRLAQRATYADYLAAEQNSESRHEFIDGVIVAMAGGSDEHNAIAGRFAGLFAASVRSGCLYYTPDQRFWIASRTRGRYADGSIICGAPEHPAHDAQATMNPTVVIEVLSPSSEGDDDGDKRSDFQSLASLEAALAAQHEATVEKEEYLRKTAELVEEAEAKTELHEVRKKLQPNDLVRVTRFDKTGRVVRVNATKNTVLVSVGLGQWEVPFDEVYPEDEPA